MHKTKHKRLTDSQVAFMGKNDLESLGVESIWKGEGPEKRLAGYRYKGKKYQGLHDVLVKLRVK